MKQETLKHRSQEKSSLYPWQIVTITALFWTLVLNIAFFRNLIKVFPISAENAIHLLSLGALLTALNTLILLPISSRPLLKWVLVPLLLVTSATAYFMDTYNTVIDQGMLLNGVQTDTAEVLDLLSFKLLLYIFFFGFLPAVALLKTTIHRESKRQILVSRMGIGVTCLLTIVMILTSQSGFFASFFREHKPLRYYANPTYTLYSVIKFAVTLPQDQNAPLQQVGEDAAIIDEEDDLELIIMVVGETARADRFSLNGYQRETNPLLSQDEVISFTDFWSCGTSTAVSVPCMFSVFPQDQFSVTRAKKTENVLDIIQKTGADVLWVDNNSDSKDVALRVSYQSIKLTTSQEVESRDEEMLPHSRQFIETHPQNDLFIVLHQMGNHGPAYYKRYPEPFERFKPVCKTNQLNECSLEEIGNTYDNGILYTDNFLHEVVELLKEYEDRYETAMFYVSDHGESLGESGLYLHGLPNILAPDSQRHVPMIMWSSDNNEDIDKAALNELKDQNYTHDNVFHTILGLLEIECKEYDPDMDLIRISKTKTPGPSGVTGSVR